MKRRHILSLVVVTIAVTAAAQKPAGTASRRAFLWRALDGWNLPISQAVVMQQDPFASVRAQAVGVLASNVDGKRLPLLVRYLDDGDARVREQVMLAAGRMGKPGLQLALHGLADTTPVVRQAAVWAASHGGPGAFEALSERLARENSRAVRETLLANLWRLEGAPWQALAASYAGNEDVYLRRAAAYSLGRTGEPPARAAQRLLAQDGEAVIRATALRGFERGALEKRDIEVLQKALDDVDWRVRAAACRALAAQGPVELSPDAAHEIAGAFSSPQPHLAVSALQAAASQGTVGTRDELLEIIGDGEEWLAAAAFAALARRDVPAATRVARTWLESDETWRRRAVAGSATVLGPAFEKAASADGDPSVRLEWLASLDEEATQQRKGRLSEMVRRDPDPAVRALIISVLRSAEVSPGVDELMKLYAAWSRDVMPDARAEALVAAVVATDRAEDRAAIIALGLTDTDPAVAAMVINGVRSLGLEVELPGREPRHGARWYEDLVSWVEKPRWLDVTTRRGSFRIRLDLEAAPVTSREISELAADGFYEGLEFHRVVPNFVVQGGDPRGDGWGGPGFVLPDEPSFTPFDSWRVGIATSGPETGGCQLFFTLLPADHLTGHYTNLGEVVEGREVLTMLHEGDAIVSITPLSGIELPPLDPGNDRGRDPSESKRKLGSKGRR